MHAAVTVVLVIVCSLLANTATARELTYGLMTINTLYYRNSNGKLEGSVVDGVLVKMQRYADFKLNYVLLPGKRLYKNLHQGAVDFSSLPLDRKAYPNIEFGKIPIISSEVVIYSLNPFAGYSGISGLAKGKVAVRRGLTYGGIRKKLERYPNKFVLTQLNSSNNIFKMLTSKRVDYVVEYAFGGNVEKQFNYQILHHRYSYIAVSKSHPQAKQLVQELDKLLLIIMHKEKLDKLY